MLRKALATGFLVASVLVIPGTAAVSSAGASTVAGASVASPTTDHASCKGKRCATRQGHHKKKRVTHHKKHSGKHKKHAGAPHKKAHAASRHHNKAHRMSHIVKH
ncbi:hypothetical protein ACGFIV_11680 [Sphaerisporangium sp. NPDC049003]|uniref:hypothetical protein n=1 Tax=Sphaerisporangium sp. NPDC049003 TaxID=3364517 RepID=UPI00371C511F